MATKKTSFFDDWPDVPSEQRPKRLPHAGTITADDVEVLRQKGWEPTDVRLLPNETDTEKQDIVKMWLEGARLGLIDLDQKAYKFIELEARIFGLFSGKGGDRQESSQDSPLDGLSYKDLLDFGKEKKEPSRRKNRRKKDARTL